MIDAVPDGYLGATGRITSGPAPELVATGYSLETADAPLLHSGLNLADLAHVLALVDATVVPRAAARQLINQLLEFNETPAADFPYDAAYGDAYNSRERELQRRIGVLAGWLHTGRTRREAGRIAFRIALRRQLLDLHEAITELVEALASQARGHAATTWADTTYLQPAQPSTFGHYLGGFGEEATRHLRRVWAAYVWVNRSPVGCGGVGGSPILTNRVGDAAILGFDEPGFHTRDIMWSVDGLVDVAVAATQAATTVDRLCEDLEIFASPAFGYVTLHASLCRASVLLPQKRNPYALAVVRSGTNVLIGQATALLAAQRTPSARTDNWLHGYGETSKVVENATRLVRLGTMIVGTLEVDQQHLAAEAASHFTGAADLAEHMVLREGLDYRTAYQVVGAAVARAVAAGRTSLELTDLAASAGEHLGRPLTADLNVAAITDPGMIVARRDVLGGSAAHRVTEHARRIERLAQRAARRRERARGSIESAENAVLARAREFSAAHEQG
ncbi:lyase family protein [Nocardioides pocheonensis]|uniref:argininosuccinate lyase n=1 Tax=Nocardioides pocheonensis TaxID=661485 RepID=A0A3N0GJI5_9ACTN|nr:lyase family protein [Nocardioides pocheonensis]RNM12210.1 argininosuccinate lyase [Nocardioides pocheonensis]